MERSCKYFQNPAVWMLALAMTVTWAISFTEGADKIQITGEIDGNVTISCPVDKQRKVRFFYFQRGDDFVNGFHESKNLGEKTKPWENTRVDGNETTVYMYGLNFSHEGDYKCYIQYTDSPIFDIHVNLKITANYSKPAVTSSCVDGIGCTVTCSSHGGYPSNRIMWDVPVSGNASSQMWKVVNSSEERSPGTVVFTISSTAYFNCSNGEMKLLRCSVGVINSERFKVCTPKMSVPPVNPYMIATVVCILVVSTVVLILLRFHCRRKTAQTSAAVWNVKACEEEVTVLNKVVATEAS